MTDKHWVWVAIVAVVMLLHLDRQPVRRQETPCRPANGRAVPMRAGQVQRFVF